MPDILHKVGIKSSSQKDVYKALTTVDGLSAWWTTDTKGKSQVGSVLQFRFGEGGFDMKVLALRPAKHVLWQVVDGPAEWLGRASVLEPMWNAWQSGDRKAAVGAVPERVMNDLIIRGSMAEIRAHIGRYLDAGIDTAFLALSTLETDPARRRAILLDAVQTLAPATRPAPTPPR